MASNLVRGTAFITGAGSGIGQHTAYALARHGVRQLTLCDIRPESLQTTINELKITHKDIQLLSIEMDTSQEDSVRSAINQTVKKFNRIDIAINNAGFGGPPLPTHQVPLADFQALLATNLTGVFLCQRSQILQMLTQEALVPPPRGNRGIIVNVASMLGLVGSSPETPAAAYTASKHALLGLTKSDAIMYAAPPHNIRINAICPGYIGTPLLKGALTAGSVMEAEVAKVPQGRLGEMEEVADAVVFLASGMSSFVVGAGMVVDGGYTAG